MDTHLPGTGTASVGADASVVGPIVVTIFPDEHARRKTVSRHTLDSLANLLYRKQPAKALLKLATFGDDVSAAGAYRHDDNLLEIHGIEIDYDGGEISFLEAENRLKKLGLECILHTTRKHAPEKPRWRVLCPASTKLTKARRTKLLDLLNGVLDGKLAAESWTLSQSWYFGNQCPAYFRVAVLRGEPIDLCSFAGVAPIPGKPTAAPRPDVRVDTPVGLSLDTEELLARVRSAYKDGPRFAALYDNGDISAYGGDNSDADIALCGTLARNGASAEQIDELFRNSALWRGRSAERWDKPHAANGETYGQMTIRKALSRAAQPKPNGSNGNGGTHVFDPQTGEVLASDQTATWKNSGKHQEWPIPLDIFGDPELTGYPQLDANCLPAALFDFVVTEAARLSVDPVALSAHVLAACSLSISDKWSVRPKFNDYTWRQQARIWVCVIKGVGTRGTDMINSAWRPVVKRQAKSQDEWRAKFAAWEARNPGHGDKKFIPNPDDPKPDRPARALTNNATVEKMADILANGTDKLAYVADELVSFLDFSRYSGKASSGAGGGSRADMLAAYDGGPKFIDRIIRGETYVPNWSVVVSGNIQGRRLDEISKFLVNDGLFQRFTVVHSAPADIVEDDDVAFSKDHAMGYEALHDAMASLLPISQDGQIIDAWFDDEARAERQQFRKLINRIKHDETLPFIISETASKWEGLLARLALVFHVVELAQLSLAQESTGPTVSGNGQLSPTITKNKFAVTGPTVIRATNYIRQILLPNLFRLGFQTMQEESRGTHARWVAQYVLARKAEKITAREIGRAYRDLRGKPEQIQRIMEYLCDAGWAAEDQQRRHDSFGWIINPAVHSIFADRAIAEKVRREKVRELIRQKVTEF